MSLMTNSDTRTNGDTPKCFGKYRGVVVNNVDPMGIGRIQVQVIGMFTLASSWAMPCFPLAGPQLGVIAVPPISAGVWVEFEHGDPDHPIWTGCYHSTRAEVPPMAQLIPPVIPAMTMQTPLQNTIQVSDAPPTPAGGGVVLRSASGAMVVVNDSGIYISDGKGATITLAAGVVTVNMGALVIK